jgi:prepilin-type N-terminal cleavage/methylation domain-containing protein
MASDGKKGYSLIELLVVLALIIVFALPVSVLMMTAAGAQRQAWQTTAAVNLAREKLEKAVAGPTNVSAGTETVDVAGLPRFTRRVDVGVPWWVDELSGLREVAVTVLWQSGDYWREVRLVTYIYGR